MGEIKEGEGMEKIGSVLTPEENVQQTNEQIRKAIDGGDYESALTLIDTFIEPSEKNKAAFSTGLEALRDQKIDIVLRAVDHVNDGAIRNKMLDMLANQARVIFSNPDDGEKAYEQISSHIVDPESRDRIKKLSEEMFGK